MTGMMTLIMLITEIIHEIYGNLKRSFTSNIGKSYFREFERSRFCKFLYMNVNIKLKFLKKCTFYSQLIPFLLRC